MPGKVPELLTRRENLSGKGNRVKYKARTHSVIVRKEGTVDYKLVRCK